MENNIGKDTLMELANKIINRDNQVKIATLSDELAISQVVKFFERQGRSFTKTMIQNYVRVGVLPPPIEKRYYTRNHLIMLTLIDSLKAIYSLEEIKTLLEPIRNNPDVFEDDLIKTNDVYRNYISMREEFLGEWKKSLPGLVERVDQILVDDGIREAEKSKATAFMVALTVMAETIAMKDIVNEIIKGYIK